MTPTHKDVTERLERIDPELYEEVKKVLGINLSERHLRGGDATKRKYEKLRADDCKEEGAHGEIGEN